MSLIDAKTELVEALQTKLGWEHAIATEWSSGAGLPMLVVEVGDTDDDDDIAGDSPIYQLSVEMLVSPEHSDALDEHRDTTNDNGLAGSLDSLPLTRSTVILQRVSTGKLADDYSEQPRVEAVFISCECEWYI